MAKNKNTEYPFKLSGYVYSKGTAEGFQKMKKQGIPRPLFRIEDKLARLIKSKYKTIIRDILKDIKNASKNTHATFDRAMLTQDNLSDDNLEDLLNFFEEMAKQEKDAIATAQNRANMAAAANTLQHKWEEEAQSSVTPEGDKFAKAVDSALKENQEDYQKRLFEDADQRTAAILSSFSLDKQKIYNSNMEMLRHLYLEDSLERLGYEQNTIKRAILRRILAYANGDSATLRLEDLTKYAFSIGDNLARLFARDQMARFNKATTLSTFQATKVTKIKWVTSHDVRVRPTHKALDGKIFNINDLPPEINDYNCRCGLVPVEWSDD